MDGPTGRRPTGDPVVKALFALSGNICAFSDPPRGLPGCEERLADPSWDSVQAVICHIRGWRPGGPRFEILSEEKRNAFENLILLCPNHSNVIDRVRPKDYSVESLLEMKARHELANGETRPHWAPAEDVLDRIALAIVAHTQLYVGRPNPMTPIPEHLLSEHQRQFLTKLKREMTSRGRKVDTWFTAEGAGIIMHDDVFSSEERLLINGLARDNGYEVTIFDMP